MKKDECIYLGSLIKTHGSNGEILIKSDYQLDEYTELESVFFEINKRLVPFFISHLRQKSNTSYIFKFDDINTETKAKEFISCDIYMLKTIFEIQIQGDDQISLNDLVDYSVLDVSGNVLGTIRAYHDIPSNPLLIIEKDGQEFLIPFHDSYIEEIDTLNKKLICRLPEGFAELND